ncbi:hypothetical protein CWC14_06460 [Pseudoalteromonas sp. S3260]|nr:hypothetical protein CWC14_06460 [Pseudoalteromonas sp. S3260]
MNDICKINITFKNRIKAMKAELNLKQRQIKNTSYLAKWTLIWLFTLAICSFGPTLIWDRSALISGFFIIINLAAGVGMILANKRYLQGMDELMQKIHLSAMGFTLGAVLVGGLAYTNLKLSGLIDFKAQIPDLMFLMGAVYLISVYVLNKHYCAGDE